MARSARLAGSGKDDIDGLLPLTLSSPREALSRARAILARRPGAYEASVARQAAGIVMRDFGDATAAIRELRQALRLARRSGSADREADVLATLGGALVYAGRTADGLDALGLALEQSRGILAGRVAHRRGTVLLMLGRHAEALQDLRQAVSVLQRAGDKIWTARALNSRGLVYVALGKRGPADADFRDAEMLFAATSQDFESIYPLHNRAMAALLSGDLPVALSCLDEAASRYRALGTPVLPLSIDRCAALLAAGLSGDALAEAEAAILEFGHLRGQAMKKAGLLLMAANCALAAGQPEAALDWAQAASRLFRSQDSAWWQAHARLVAARARYAAGTVSVRSLHEASDAVARLEALGAADAAQAHLLAGRIALGLGRQDDADQHFAAAARARRRGPPMARTAGWLSVALRAEAAAQPRRLLSACRSGLDVLDEHQLTLGASELRAQATAHGAELAMLALRHAARAGRPRLLLTWSERWRATALAVPPVRPAADPQLGTALTALREVTNRLDQARGSGRPATGLAREQARLENEVRGCALRARGTGASPRTAVNIAELLDELGDTRLVQIIDIDDVMHVLVCGAGRVRHVIAGRTSEASRAADFARFALRRLARWRPGDESDSALAILRTHGPRLQQALLEPAVRHLGDQPVVIVPPARLHAIPWALLPALGDRVFSVAPSAGAWLRTRNARPPGRRHVTLARGPGLVSGGAEVPAVARLYDDVTMLTDADATSERVLGAIDGAWLAHVAAHGSFRADSPLFSSLRMHDGPLTVYDFEQLKSAPYRLILSSCDSGVQASAGADELLGLVSSLLPLGTAGIVAGIGPLNDHAVVPVMVALHECLRGGQTLAESMQVVRHDLRDDPIQRVTAASLVTLGAA